MTETNTPQITAGSTSTDICRLDHIVDGIRCLAGSDKKLSDLIDEFDNVPTQARDLHKCEIADAGAWLFLDIMDRLNDIAPDNLTFGAHPNDGADFGFWEVDES